MTNFEKVGVFMKTFNQDVKDSSSLSTDKINSLRISLINEELEELKQAISEKNLTEVADVLGAFRFFADFPRRMMRFFFAFFAFFVFFFFFVFFAFFVFFFFPKLKTGRIVALGPVLAIPGPL